MHNYISVKKDLIWANILFLNFILYFFYLKTGAYIFLAFYFLTGFSLFSIFAQRKINIKLLAFFIIIIFCFSVFSLFSQEFPYYINMYNMLYGITAFMSAYALFFNKYSLPIVKLAFILYASFVFYTIYRLGFNDPDLYNHLLEGSSRNYLSAILVLLLVLLLLVYEKNKEKVPIVYPLITFLGCIALFGRSGILFSFLILLYFVFKNFGLRIFLSILFSLFVFVICYFSNIQNIFLERTNFIHGISSERTIFLHEYLQNIIYSPYDLFFGRKLQMCCNWITSFNSNPHNSFIMGHIRYGILHTSFSIFILLYLIFSKNLTYIFLGLVIFSRISIDQLGLFSAFDVVLFFLLFLIFHSHRK